MLKLTKEEVRAIRKDNTLSQYALAKKYKTSQSNVSKIKARLIWKHV